MTEGPGHITRYSVVEHNSGEGHAIASWYTLHAIASWDTTAAWYTLHAIASWNTLHAIASWNTTAAWESPAANEPRAEGPHKRFKGVTGERLFVPVRADLAIQAAATHVQTYVHVWR